MEGDECSPQTAGSYTCLLTVTLHMSHRLPHGPQVSPSLLENNRKTTKYLWHTVRSNSTAIMVVPFQLS